MKYALLLALACLTTTPSFAASDCSFQAKATAFRVVVKDMIQSNLPISALSTSIASKTKVTEDRGRYYINALTAEATDTSEHHVIVDVSMNTCKVLSVQYGGF